MLSAAPIVLDIEVASSLWSPAFVEHLQTAGLGTNGYSIPQGSAAQSASLTWTNLDRIFITFSEDVNIDAADLSLSGINSVAYGFSHFQYDPQTHVAAWTLVTPINKDRLRLDLDADGLDPVSDLDGTVLDGEWTNNTSTVSGNGTAGGDFEFNFNVLPTDINNTANITNYDYIYIRQLDGKSTTSIGYIAKRDIDGSGLIDSTDYQEALDRMFQALPSGSPAGTSNDAPTTFGFDRLQIDNYAVDAAVALLAGFDDAENGSSGLTYSIVSNSDPSLFDYVFINQSTNQLILNSASGASGRATVTVRATDVGGLFAETSVTVDVDRENQPPVITQFHTFALGYDTWFVTGYVSDPDDDVSSLIVEFYGVFATRSAVNEEGHFEFAVILDEDDWGWEFAITHDPHGAASNEAFCDIGLT